MTSIKWDIFGWIGFGALLTAYAMNSFGIFSASDMAYQALNLVGGAGMSALSFYKKAYPPAILNTIWAGIALFSVMSNII